MVAGAEAAQHHTLEAAGHERSFLAARRTPASPIRRPGSIVAAGAAANPGLVTRACPGGWHPRSPTTGQPLTTRYVTHKLRVALPKVNLRARPLPARLRDRLYDRVADVR
ncbi:hypothetical protein [Mycobacterium avium]|uniref:hypothetical protein n=1 Tax=Mycobacterium avium TaxID=1764 RepID=UPI001CC73313|nr:hypothetical protein [Mycobacterium avium]MBZ4535839.1 hypothetical protein [Mycobacterium avium subsp. hominissuis]MBZ4593066.1 hypothetical protein [Mycobacterium avium subsp. hominissuis]MBZ4636039.1 hypothetical protein [Mycobacterium avium subsp. hominissuis]